MVKASGKQKIKLANKTYRHDKKRRDKARLERTRKAQAVERHGMAKNAKRRSQAAYVANLEAELS